MSGTLENHPVPAIDTEGTDAMFKVTVLYNEPTKS